MASRSASATSPANSRPVSTSVLAVADVDGRVAPPAGALQPHRQPGGNGERAAAVEGHRVRGGRPAGAAPASYPLNRPGSSRRRRSAREVSQSLAAPEASTGGGVPASSSCASSARRSSKSTGAAVVGIDERVLPQLAALVDVGHARHRQLHELLAQRVRPPVRRDPLDERRQRRADRVVVVGGVDGRVHGGLERRVTGSVQVVEVAASRIAFSA